MKCKCLWIAIIGIYVNFMVFLFTDFSLWYFFGLTVFLGTFACLMNNWENRYKVK